MKLNDDDRMILAGLIDISVGAFLGLIIYGLLFPDFVFGG